MSEKKLENLENLELSEKELEEVAGGEFDPTTDSYLKEVVLKIPCDSK